MVLHSFTEYLKYTWQAKGRHGTHSPFVYELIEQVLLDKGGLKNGVVRCPWLPLRYENLISRIAAYYGYKEIMYLPADTTNTRADVLLINEALPGKWAALMDAHLHLLNNEGAIIISDIHKTAAHSSAWKACTLHAKTRMSIDLYGIGLLFFKEEFKERQHFVLKY